VSHKQLRAFTAAYHAEIRLPVVIPKPILLTLLPSRLYRHFLEEVWKPAAGWSVHCQNWSTVPHRAAWAFKTQNKKCYQHHLKKVPH